MSKDNFAEKCYRALRRVPAGKVTTYKALAHAINSRAYRAVGRAMKLNPHAPRVPCHRVVCSNGRLGGFAKGPDAKQRLLKREGVSVSGGRILDFQERLFKFKR